MVRNANMQMCVGKASRRGRASPNCCAGSQARLPAKADATTASNPRKCPVALFCSNALILSSIAADLSSKLLSISANLASVSSGSCGVANEEMLGSNRKDYQNHRFLLAKLSSCFTLLFRSIKKQIGSSRSSSFVMKKMARQSLMNSSGS